MAIIKRPPNLPRKFTHKSENPLTIRELLNQLGFTDDELLLMQFFVNDITANEQQRVGKRHVLADKSNLFITIPVGGG